MTDNLVKKLSQIEITTKRPKSTPTSNATTMISSSSSSLQPDNSPKQQNNNKATNASHLPLVISSFTRPARPPPSISPKRLTIYTEAGIPQILGRGTFGVVYPGMLDAVCPVAVKHLCSRSLRSTSTPVSRESANDAISRHSKLAKLQFRREIRRYCALHTVPGVVRFYGLVGKDMFIIERLFGGTLNSIIRKKEDNTPLLSPKCVLKLAIMLTNAVADLHRRGMSHGDLKPSNVLLSEPLSKSDGVVTNNVHVKLVDFGLSRRFHPLDENEDYDYDFTQNSNSGDKAMSDNDDDDFESVSVSNSSTSTTKITQSVQLAARRYSCPITRPETNENSDTEISDDEDETFNLRRRIRRNKAKKLKQKQERAAEKQKQKADQGEGEGEGEGENSEDDEDEEGDDDDDDDENSIISNQVAAFPQDARGTPAYLSPEGWCGPSALQRRHVAFKSDVYAIGMMLYEMETGLIPWQSMSEWAIFVAVSNNEQRPNWNRDGPRVAGLREVIESCWAQNHRHRPSCRQLSHKLQNLLRNLNENMSENMDSVVMHKHHPMVHAINESQLKHNNARVKHPHNHHINKVDYTTPPVHMANNDNTTTTTDSSKSTSSTNVATPTTITPSPSYQTSTTTSNNHHHHQPILLTPPSSPARTSSHPSPGVQVLQHNNHNNSNNNNIDLNSVTNSNLQTSSMQQPPDFPMSTQPPFDLQQQQPKQQQQHQNPHAKPYNLDNNNKYDPLSNHHQAPTFRNRADQPPKIPSDIKARAATSKLLDTPSSPNQILSSVSPSARQQRKDSLKRGPPSTRNNGPINNHTNYNHNESSNIQNKSDLKNPNVFNGIPPATNRSLEYPYKDLVVRDDCQALCNLVITHERNQKEILTVLEALAVTLDNSRKNCEIVANSNTLTYLATILSRYGPKDSKLCKSICVIILRLAITKSPIVEMRLRVTSAIDMVLNCMRWHAADLPIIQNGSCALEALCKLSNALCSIFVSQNGPSSALRALSRAAKTFNHDVLIGSVALQILSEIARQYSHALLTNDILQGLFIHCDNFKNDRIDNCFISVIHPLLRNLQDARDKIIVIPECFIVFSNLILRTRGLDNWIPTFHYTCEIVSDLARSSLRNETSTGVLKSHIVESIIETLNILCDKDYVNNTSNANGNNMNGTPENPDTVYHDFSKITDLNAGASGLICLLQLSALGADIIGEFQSCNVFDMARKYVKRAPNNHSIAYHVSLLIFSVLQQSKNGSARITNKDLLYDMLVEMKEKWRHDVLVVESVSKAMELLHPASSSDKMKKPKLNPRLGANNNNNAHPHLQQQQQQHPNNNNNNDLRPTVDPNTKFGLKEQRGGLFKNLFNVRS